MRPSLTPRPTDQPALGMLEVNEVAPGFAIADRVIKQAAVELLLCEPVTPAKFLVLFAGEVEAVSSSLRVGIEEAGEERRIDELFLPVVHPSLLDAVRGSRPVATLDSLGVVETRTVAASLRAADAAAKAGEVELLRLRAAMRLHGGAFFILTGALSQVEAAVARAIEVAGDGLRTQVVIPRPHEGLGEFLI